MTLPKQRKWLALLGVGIVIVIMTVTVVIAQELHYPTYEYYGETLSAEAFLALVETEVPLHCAQILTLESYLSDRAPVDFICFNTLDEVADYRREVTAPAQAQFSQEHPEGI